MLDLEENITLQNGTEAQTLGHGVSKEIALLEGLSAGALTILGEKGIKSL